MVSTNIPSHIFFISSPCSHNNFSHLLVCNINLFLSKCLLYISSEIKCSNFTQSEDVPSNQDAYSIAQFLYFFLKEKTVLYSVSLL